MCYHHDGNERRLEILLSTPDPEVPASLFDDVLLLIAVNAAREATLPVA